jgi:hypothetical protein
MTATTRKRRRRKMRRDEEEDKRLETRCVSSLRYVFYSSVSTLLY